MSVPRGDIEMVKISGRSIPRLKLRAVLLSHNNKHGFRGIFWDQKAHKFRAQIGKRCNRRSLGRYKTAKEAALAYDKAAIELYGDDAALNFPLPGERKTKAAKGCSRHGLTDVYIDLQGAPHCRICNRDSVARYKKAMEEAGLTRKKYGPWFEKIAAE